LWGIARYTCLMHLRVQRVQDLSLEFLMEDGGWLPSEAPDPAAIAERMELRQMMLAALDELSPANRETVMLFYYDDFDLRETAAALGISVNTTKGRLHRARKHLHQLLSVSAFIDKGANVMIPVKLVDVVLREIELTEEQKNSIRAAMPEVDLGENTSRKHYQLVLMDEMQRRALVIWIGEYEGLAIAARLNGQERPRPMTLVFMHRLIEASGARLERVEISKLVDEVFYATAHLWVNGELKQVDARPSDAIALALYTDTPLFVSETVMAEAGAAIPEKAVPTRQGLAEIQANLGTLRQAEVAVAQQRAQQSEAGPWRDAKRETEITISKAFAEPAG
jgi:uncharacterized protein